MKIKKKIWPELVQFYQSWADLRRSDQILEDLGRSANICMDLVKYGMTEFVFEVMLTFVLQLARFAAQDGPAKERQKPVEMFICEKAAREWLSLPLVLIKKDNLKTFEKDL